MRPHMRFGALLDQHTLDGFPDFGFSLPFYIIQYHIRRNDALSSGVLYDSPLDFLIWVPNILESIFGYPNRAANKNSCPLIWIIFEL